MKRISFLFLSILFILLVTKTVTKAQTGEPISGAEIYVELEPDDEPIACCPGGTGTSGQYFFALPPKLMKKIATNIPFLTNKGTKQYKLKSFFKLPAGYFEKNLQSIKNPDDKINVKFTFVLKVQNGKQTVTKQFEVIISKKPEIGIKAAQKYGPVIVSLTDPKSSDVNFTLQLISMVPPLGSKTGKNPL